MLVGRAWGAVARVTAAALLAVACGTDGDTAAPDPTAETVAATAAQATAEPSPPAPVPTKTTSVEATPAPSPTPGLTATSVAAATGPATGEPSPVPTVSASTQKTPIATPTADPALYLHQSGLACYGIYLTGWENEIDYDQAVGFPTLEEAATDWRQNTPEARSWHRRDGSFSISADDLTQSPPTSPPKGRGSAASGINPEDQPTPPPTAIYYRDHNDNAQIVIYGRQLDNGNWIIRSGLFCTYMEE